MQAVHIKQIMTTQKRDLLINGFGAILRSAALVSGAFAQAPVTSGFTDKIAIATTKADHEQLAGLMHNRKVRRQ